MGALNLIVFVLFAFVPLCISNRENVRACM